jgi:integrase
LSQHTDVALPQIVFTRTDYTALRMHCERIPLQRIADLCYSEDSPQVEQGLERFLVGMRNALIERAIEHNPAFAEILKGARQGGAITAKALRILIEAADMPASAPQRMQRVSQWFRPKTARSLREEGVVTLGDLVELIERRGAGWWRSIPRIGAGRAQAILAWLGQFPEQLGEIRLEGSHPPAAATFDLLPVLDPRVRRVAPLGTFQLPPWLSGADGANRAPMFCFIGARNDLEAVQAYLLRYEGQVHTQRAYGKELERFVLWCALVAGKPLSSLLVDDCEAYKSFLRAPFPEFRGARAPRSSKRWRPFAEEPMTAASQRQAILVLRAAFDWLVKVRYLGGNPWVAIKDPVVVRHADEMQIDRALTEDAWTTVVDVLRLRGDVLDNHQDRAALAAVLLMGDSGLRRTEAASATRDNVRPGKHAAGVWMLKVIGKRSKERRVPVSPRTIAALRAYWRDRGLDFDGEGATNHLLGPVVVPNTPAAIARHAEGSSNGYRANSLYDLVAVALRRVRDHASALTPEDAPLLSPDDLAQLAETSPHAFRHTFGTLSVEKGMPLDVTQEILGHASASTTKIYVRAKEKRIAEAAAKYYGAEGVPSGAE